MAAFDRRVFHGVKCRGSKILLPKACLLPLTEGCFIVSKAEATKSCFRGQIAAFDRSEFHRVKGKGSRNKEKSREWLPPGKKPDRFLIIHINGKMGS